MGMATRTATGPRMTTMSRSGFRPATAKLSSTCSRTAFRRASGSVPKPGLGSPRRAASVETVRPDGARQIFAFVDRGGFLESIDEIPEPHAFRAHVAIDGETHAVAFEEHEHAHGAAARDNNFRAAFSMSSGTRRSR